MTARELAVPLLVALAACGSIPARHSLRGQHSVPVGESPEFLLLAPGGHELLCLNTGDHSLSWIDLRSRRETARLRLPFAPKGEGDRAYGHLSGFKVDLETGTIWVVSNVGHIFSIDPETRAATTRFRDYDYEFSALAWDPRRHRLLVGTYGGMIYEFSKGRLNSIVERYMVISGMRRHGSLLFYMAGRGAVFGEGDFDSAIGVLDLRTDKLLFEPMLERGVVSDLAVSDDGRVWAADFGTERLLEFSTKCELRATRTIPDYLPTDVETAGDRLLVAQGGTPIQPVLEYRRAAGGMPTSPVLEFPLPGGSLSAILPLPGGGVAVALGHPDRVLLLGADRARPYSRER
ncbi:MAG: YncE family protein [Planctomycetota bacterium]|jgi:streptogramin lyase